jgi:thymidine phosphorylase
MSSTIDSELVTLHARIAELSTRAAQLEEAKKNPPPVLTAHECLEKAKESIKRSKGEPGKIKSPVALACRYSYESMTSMLGCVVESLNRIHARLDALESR